MSCTLQCKPFMMNPLSWWSAPPRRTLASKPTVRLRRPSVLRAGQRAVHSDKAYCATAVAC